MGPTAAAARLETSKAWAKEFMARHRVPTARFVVAETEADALAAARSGSLGWPLVVKADGLAAGKGVVVAADLAEAEATIRDMMSLGRFGAAGARVVLEECLTGPEVSFFVLTDGERAMAIGTAQDHKRVFDDDRGPNTGGMGAFSPSPLADEALAERVTAEVVRPVIDGMRAEGHPYRGFLYCGLMLTERGPRVIEFNARLGDPETQVLLPLGEPLLPLLQSVAAGTLPSRDAIGSGRKRVGVVVASGGYPGEFASREADRRARRGRGARGRARFFTRARNYPGVTSSAPAVACSPSWEKARRSVTRCRGRMQASTRSASTARSRAATSGRRRGNSADYRLRTTDSGPRTSGAAWQAV